MLGALVSGALLGSALSGGGSEPKAPQKMSYDEALKQAEDALRPVSYTHLTLPTIYSV